MPEGLLEGEPETDRRAWFDDIAATLGAPHLHAVPMLVVEVRTGRIIGSTPAAEALLGGPPGPHLSDLVARGTLSGPALGAFRDRTRSWLASLDPATTLEEADAWSDEVRIHRGGTASTVRLDVLCHRRPLHGGEIAVVTLTAVSTDATAPAPPDRTTPELWSILDANARIVAVDPGWSVLWADPERTVGSLVSLLVHPEDLAEVLPISHELFAGRLPQSTYTVRLAADDGRWVPVEVTHRALLTGGDLLVMASNRIVDESRRLILPGMLTAREVEVVRALFDGQRVAQIAERHGTSVHTVRNQLRSVYRKLGATSQADLLARFHRPAAV